jgi:hypothetical protein
MDDGEYPGSFMDVGEYPESTMDDGKYPGSTMDDGENPGKVSGKCWQAPGCSLHLALVLFMERVHLD